MQNSNPLATAMYYSSLQRERTCKPYDVITTGLHQALAQLFASFDLLMGKYRFHENFLKKVAWIYIHS